METPQEQRWLKACCLVLLCAFSQLSHAKDAQADEPAQDGPFDRQPASNGDDGGQTVAPSDIAQDWKTRDKKHHVGLSIGAAKLKMPCIEGMVCRKNGKALTLYAGGDLSQRWGFELAYMRMSNMEYAGNAVRVRGLTLTLLGELPIGSRFSLTGRLGTNYARTRMDLTTNASVPTGSAQGFGLSYGASLNWRISERWSASTDVNRHDFKFVTGHDNVDTATLSLRYRY